MGKKSSKSCYQPLIVLVFGGRKLNLYSIPETYQDFEIIAYNFYYAYTDKISAFENLRFNFNSRGFLKQNIEITNKRTYKKSIKCSQDEPIEIIINIEQ